ncbi:MAG: GDP-L-fucose synthase family protein [Gammaproteobacteria bacterium]
MNKTARIYLAGHTGLVGSAIHRRLQAGGFTNLLMRSHAELELRDQGAVNRFFEATKPDYVILAAARVGGILANSTRPAEFIYDNLMIDTHVIHAAYRNGVRKLLNLGSSCIYPRLAPQPIKEEYLLSGALEPTNRAYAIAKITAIELCDHYRSQYGCDFISAMPTNLYGPGDNFDLSTSHVLPALIRKFHEARLAGSDTVTIWGSGTPRREFLHVDDMADAALFLLEHYSAPGPINVGSGVDMTIRELAELIARVVGFQGRLQFDASKPDGTPRKLLDVSQLRRLGWSSRISLEEGIRRDYDWYRGHYPQAVNKA